MTDDFTAANRLNWDERVAVHLRDAGSIYPIDAFRAGADTLMPIETAEIGDVSGRRIAHLQCHFGLDSLSLARRGADVTGLDFSASAIAAARALAEDTGLSARFVEGDVYEARSLLAGHFDMVYVTWGTIIWLPDIRKWAATVASLLAPGGNLYLAEGHPFLPQFAEEDGKLLVAYDWRTPLAAPPALPPSGPHARAHRSGHGAVFGPHRLGGADLHVAVEIADAAHRGELVPRRRVGGRKRHGLDKRLGAFQS